MKVDYLPINKQTNKLVDQVIWVDSIKQLNKQLYIIVKWYSTNKEDWGCDGTLT